MKINNTQPTNFNGKLIVKSNSNSYFCDWIKNNKTLNEVAKEAGKYDICATVKRINGHGNSRGTDGDFYKLSVAKVKESTGFLEKIKSLLPFTPKVSLSKRPHCDKTMLQLFKNRFTKEALKDSLNIK